MGLQKGLLLGDKTQIQRGEGPPSAEVWQTSESVTVPDNQGRYILIENRNKSVEAGGGG